MLYGGSWKYRPQMRDVEALAKDWPEEEQRKAFQYAWQIDNTGVERVLARLAIVFAVIVLGLWLYSEAPPWEHILPVAIITAVLLGAASCWLFPMLARSRERSISRLRAEYPGVTKAVDAVFEKHS